MMNRSEQTSMPYAGFSPTDSRVQAIKISDRANIGCSCTYAVLSSPATRHGGAWGERSYSSYSFLTSALDWGEWSASHPAALCPGERTPGIHCTGGWVGPRAGLDTDARGKILCPCRGSNLHRLVVQSAARHYTD
jgi:hypothetical protein